MQSWLLLAIDREESDNTHQPVKSAQLCPELLQSALVTDDPEYSDEKVGSELRGGGGPPLSD